MLRTGQDSLDVPRFRIQAVAEQTGIATATLRAWERRYGIPEPARSDSRYRLYSDRDVAVVQRMAALCAAGLRPAEAARTAKAETHQRPPGVPLSPDPGVVQRIVEAYRRFDLDALRAALDHAFSSGTAAQAYDAFVSPAMHEVGELWAQGDLSVAQEHAGTHLVRMLLANLLRLASPEPPAPVALLACFEEEQHDIGLLGFGLHLAGWGYRSTYLGQRVPPKAVAEAIALQRPTVVAIGMVMGKSPEEARATLTAYAKACGSIPWIVGGPGSAELADIVRKRGGHLAPPHRHEVRELLAELTHAKNASRAPSRS